VVQGSLDAPPIILRSSRIIPLVGAVGVGVLAASKLPSTFAIIGLASTVLIAGLPILFPSKLVLEPGSLTLKSFAKTQHWSWDDIGNFRVKDFGTIMFDAVERVTYEDDPNYLEKTPPIVPASLWFGWDKDAVDILEAARARWAKKSNVA
jgi:hypothetical protein